MDSQLAQYFAVFVLLLTMIAVAGGIIVASTIGGQIGTRLRGNRTKEQIKDTAYECGMIPIGDNTPRLSVKFYLVAMLFILFDIEVVLLYLWAVVYKDMLITNANMIFGSMLSFLGILFVGYIYAWKKDAFNWKS